jgi:N-acyl-D-aspartate/D-glutamate deacylase
MRLKHALFIPALALTLSALGPARSAPQPSYDILIKNGLVYDGSLDPPARLDVGVKGDKIVKVAPAITGSASRVIDASGMIVTPGFIDLHTHVNEGMYFPENRACLNFLTQGVTSVVVGQCGGSAWPIFEQARDLIRTWTAEGIGPNAALLVGHGQVREIVMGRENRAPTPDELSRMKALVKEAMDQGAAGMSTGLIYVPGSYAKTDEIIALAKIVAPYGGIYHTHIRNERDKLLEALREAIEISKQAGLPVHISHFKAMGRANWGSVKEACAVIEAARAEGVRITADQYPFRFANGDPYEPLVPRSIWASGAPADRLSGADIAGIFGKLSDAELIGLYAKVTPYAPLSPRHREFLSGLTHSRLVQYVAPVFVGPSDFQGAENMRERALFLKRMADPAEAARIRKAVRTAVETDLGPENYVVGVCSERSLEGLSLAEVAARKNETIEDAAIELDLMGAKVVPMKMCEPDIEYIMAKDWVGTGSDATSPPYGVGLVHIRAYTTFPRKIKNYALDKPVVSLSHAVRSMTSLPAKIMDWGDRGWIKEGFKADIAVIDLDKLETPATISNPQQYSRGVETLLINGVAAIENGGYTGKLPGKVLTIKGAAAKPIVP